MKRAARITATVLILTLLVATFGCAKSGTSDGGELKILSHSMTVHELAGDVTINFATIAVNFYDKNKNLIATASAVKQNLQPNEIWDFNVKTIGPDAWKSVSYDIAASTK
jgi:hypothetical protein